MILLDILLFIVLIVCIITDLKVRKIYNNVILPSLLIAIMIHLFNTGILGLIDSLQGFAVGLGVLIIPYFLGGMGAGDVKLLALIGAIKGSGFVLVTSIYMALFGGVMAIAFLLFQKGVYQKMKVIIYSVCGIRFGVKIPLAISKDRKATLPYGVAIAAGAFLSLWMKGELFI
ncbi:MAG: prepilin peptidase [Bacillales bacterium]|jgi:prepilin peptidase CpaA|nr:prepilin peptidase [Bacillales bacterium]